MTTIGRRSRVRRTRMKGANLGYPRKLSLFRTLFDDGTGMPEGAGFSDPLLLLALARMDFLRSHEKMLLAEAVDSRKTLLALRHTAVEAIILRKLDQECWKPAAYWEKAVKDNELFITRGISFISIADPRYPPQLREVYRPPFGLYIRGRLPDPERPAVSIVGTRIPTGHGLHAAFELAAELSSKAVCIVSGLARGIDTAAHRGALKGSGKTIAVLPGGIETVYPSSNKALAASIIDAGGALVTEYPPCSLIHRYCFPERNRIIAGLSRSCVVVEAPLGSGALITADHALTEGRDVFVHGACIGSARDSGAEVLTSQGAGIVNNAQDLFREWAAKGSFGSDAQMRRDPIMSL